MVLAGIVSFLPVAGEVHCFGFQMRKMLITHWGFSSFELAGRGGIRSWEGTGPGTASPNWSQGYFIPYGIILSKNLGGELLLLRGLAGHQLWGGEHLYCASLVFCVFFFYHYYYFFLLFCPIQLSLSHPTSFTFFQCSFPFHWGAVRECLLS